MTTLNFSTNELRRLHKNFSKIDRDGSGEIEPDELHRIEELKGNPLVDRIIDVLDRNKDGSISFLEFAQGLNALSSKASDEEKLRFAF